MGPDRTRPPGIWIIVGLQLVITALWVGDLALRTELSGDGFQALVASSDVLRALLIAWAGGVVLASIAATFFAGVVAKYWLFGA